MCTPEHLCVCPLSMSIRPGSSAGVRGTHAAVAGRPPLPLRGTTGFPSVARGLPQSQHPIPKPTSVVLQFAGSDAQRAGFPTPNPGGPPGAAWAPTRRALLDRCETSGYNTGPGRCSDPSCLVLQPEGRRCAAEPAPSRGDSQRDREVGAVPAERPGQPAASLFLGRGPSRGRVSPHPWFASGGLCPCLVVQLGGRSGLLTPLLPDPVTEAPQ